MARAIRSALCLFETVVPSQEKTHVLYEMPQGAADPAQAGANASASPDAGAYAEAFAMKRLLEAVVHGIPSLFYIECASCLFWRGVLVGAVAGTGLMGAVSALV